MLADTAPKEKVETLRDTMGDVKATPLIATLLDKLGEAKAEITLAH